MARTSFGEQLELLLQDKGWSSADLSDRIYNDGGNNRTQIDRWRKIGRNRSTVRITEDSLELLVKALDLSYADAVYFYGLAGKIPPLKMPSFRQVKRSLDVVSAGLGSFPFPAYVLDSRYYRFWLVNAATARLVGGDDNVFALANCSVLQLIFSRKYGVADLFGEKLPDVQREQIRRYKALNIMRRHEHYYMEYPDRLKEKDGLTDAEYAAFLEVWNNVEADSLPAHNAVNDVEYTLGGTSITFRLTAETILDLDNLFSITWYDIRDQSQRDMARSIFASGNVNNVLRMWDLPGVNLQALLE